MSEDQKQVGSPIEERLTRLERELDITQTLLARVVVTTMVASFAVRHIGTQISAAWSNAQGPDADLGILLRSLQVEADRLDRALAEASRAE